MSLDQPSYLMIVDNGRLLPAHPLDQERLMTYANGTEVECVWKSVKNGKLIRKLYVVTGLAVKQCPTPWKTADEAVQAMKSAGGLATTVPGMHGEQFRILRSLNDLDEPELLDFMELCWLLLQKVTGVDPLTLRKEAGDTISSEATSAALAGSADEPPNGGEEAFARPSLAATEPTEISENDASVTAQTPDASGEAAPHAPPHQDAASPPPPPARERLRAEMITKLFRLASEALPADARIEALESTRTAWADALGEDAVRIVFDTITKVIKGELPAEAARRFLKGG